MNKNYVWINRYNEITIVGLYRTKNLALKYKGRNCISTDRYRIDNGILIYDPEPELIEKQMYAWVGKENHILYGVFNHMPSVNGMDKYYDCKLVTVKEIK